MNNHKYEFHGFTIVESCSTGDWLVFGNIKNGFIGCFDTSKDAEDFIIEIL